MLIGGIIWQFLKWRYEGIIEGLEHRLQLRDDTILRYESGGTLPVVSSNAEESLLIQPRLPQTVTPAPLQSKGGQTASIDRNFIASSVTPNDLRKIYSNSTSIQADRQAKAYIGKWMEVAGSVRSVYGHTNNQIRLRLLDQPQPHAGIGLNGLWLTFHTDQAILETLKVNDLVTAIGEISEFSEFDIYLTDCQLIKAE